MNHKPVTEIVFIVIWELVKLRNCCSVGILELKGNVISYFVQ